MSWYGYYDNVLWTLTIKETLMTSALAVVRPFFNKWCEKNVPIRNFPEDV